MADQTESGYFIDNEDWPRSTPEDDASSVEDVYSVLRRLGGIPIAANTDPDFSEDTNF